MIERAADNVQEQNEVSEANPAVVAKLMAKMTMLSATIWSTSHQNDKASELSW